MAKRRATEVPSSDFRDLSERISSVFDVDTGCCAEESGADITFAVGTARFRVHKWLLCASSEPFRAMFRNGMRETHAGEVKITEISQDVFRELLAFVYTGQVRLSVTLVMPLLAAADRFEISALRSLCLAFILRNASEIFKSDLILGCAESLVHQLAQSDELAIAEIDLFTGLVRWGEDEAARRGIELREVLRDVIACVRFPHMTAKNLFERVRPLAGLAFDHSLLIEALFFHLQWGHRPDCLRMKPRCSPDRKRKRKKVNFAQKITWSDGDNEDEDYLFASGGGGGSGNAD